MVSSDFGKLDVQRHFNSGVDCAIAGIATVVAAAAAPVSPAALRNSRRFMDCLPEKPFVDRAMRSRSLTERCHDLGITILGKVETPPRHPRVRHFRLRRSPDAKTFG